jgi:protein O-GlcNAc transferase
VPDNFINDANEAIRLFNKKDFLNTKKFLKKVIPVYLSKGFFDNLYGVILSLENNDLNSIDFFNNAIKKEPHFPDPFYNLGCVFLKTNAFEKAQEYLKKAISLKKNYYEAYFNLGNVYLRRSFFDEAIKCYNLCLNLKNNDCEVYNNLGIIYKRRKKYESAIEYFKKSLDFNENYAPAYNNLGLIYSFQGQLDLSIFNFKKSINIQKNFYEAHNNLAVSYQKKKNYVEAINILNNVITEDKNNFVAYNNLANCYQELDKYELAIELHKKSIAINGKFEEAHNCLGITLSLNGNYYEAINSFNTALMLKADYVDPCINLGTTYFRLGNIEEGLNYYEKGRSIDPDVKILYDSLIFFSNYVINFSKKKYFDLVYHSRRLDKIIDKNKILPFQYQDNKKIKIGFVSGDLRNHPVGYFIENILLKLKDEFELYAYNNHLKKEDDLTLRLKTNFKSWASVFYLDDLDLINLIRKDGINILFDLSGWTDKSRIEIFKYKPAPIQVSWAGYLASTGYPEMDYIIGDPIVTPKKDDNHFSEKVWRLPNIWCSLMPPKIDFILNKETPALRNKYITFGAFCNLSKINTTIIELWSKILSSVKDSKLSLRAKQFKDKELKNKFINLFLERNVQPHQLIIQEGSDRKTLLNDYNNIDIVLDTFPYGGGTTSFEAAWMGVPILTKKGDTFLSRCGESINSNLNMNEWTALNNEDYVTKAIKFASDINILNNFKKKLIESRENSVLFNDNIFSNQFKDALIEMWSIYKK